MPRKVLFVLVLVLASYGYGVATGRTRLFPHDVIAPVYVRIVGLFADAPDEVRQIERRPGLWHVAQRDGRQMSGSEMERLRKLANQGYAGGYEPAPEIDSVTIHDADAAYDGLNLVVSGHAPQAFLLDMEGNALHEWHYDPADAWPDLAEFQDRPGFETFWRRAHVFPNGDLLAIFDGIGMIKLDRDSDLIWANPGRSHHDLFVDEHGTIFTLSRQERTEHDRLQLEGPIQEDFITVP